VGTYEQAGVGGQRDALSAVQRYLTTTFDHPENAQVITGFGHYASVLKLTDELAIAICTDGVGSKTLIASALDRYDTIGYDCVAMNANDIICVGARPIAMVDYLGVHTLDARRTGEIVQGLAGAAKEAGMAIPGGETAQLPEVIGSDGKIGGDETAFDLVGTCIGTVHPDRMMLGDEVEPGDALLGIRSSGIHSNGLTLARHVLLKSGKYDLKDHVSRLGRTVGEELLRPTEIYVRAALALWSGDVRTKGMVHITGDGFANLCRLDSPVGYRIESLPGVPAIFSLIQEAGSVETAEMYRVFNMGIGFVVVVSEASAEDARSRIDSLGYHCERIGTVTEESGIVRIEPAGLVGTLEDGESEFRTA
jgi:phosphoribosylformylglycinamidine cyclo-ligase